MRAVGFLALSLTVGACGVGEGVGKHELAQQRAGDELGGQSYQRVHGTRACLVDCAGHEAGYRWARERRIIDASLCISRSQSFNEGCEAYAEDLAQLTAQLETSHQVALEGSTGP